MFGEMAAGLLRIFMRDVKIHMVIAIQLHPSLSMALATMSRGAKRQARVILMHELLTAQVAEHGPHIRASPR